MKPSRIAKSVKELLESNNATKHLQLLLKTGYDDINFISQTDDDELIKIGIVSKTERDQVIFILRFVCLLPHHCFSFPSC